MKVAPKTLGIRKGMPGGISWSSYWNTLISAIIANAAPTNVLLTFPSGKPSLLYTDLTCTVNGVARTINSASWTGAVWTVVLASAIIYGDVVVMTFVRTGQTANVTNNVLYTILLTSTGTGAGVSTIKMNVSSNITVNITSGTARFYSDEAGTLDESSTWNLTSGAQRTIYLKAPSGSSIMTFSDISKLIKWGSSTSGNVGWISSTNAARIEGTIPPFLTELNSIGNAVWLGPLPSMMTYLRFAGNLTTFTYNGALPLGMLNYLLSGDFLTWVYNGALPSEMKEIYLNSPLINWTGLDVGNNGNYVNNGISLLNYRIAKMSSADMITLLTQMTNRTGTFPATVTINDYADYAAPPEEVVTAVNTLKAAKSITTVTLGA